VEKIALVEIETQGTARSSEKLKHADRRDMKRHPMQNHWYRISKRGGLAA
jgi:hypothetical protein